LFLTHPPSLERLNNVDAMAVAAGLPAPNETNLRASAYQTMLNNLVSSGSSR
jgi:hypothetical protein